MSGSAIRAALFTVAVTLLSTVTGEIRPAGADPVILTPWTSSAAAAVTTTPTLTPRWTLADRPSSRVADVTDIEMVAPDGIVVDGRLLFGPGFSRTTAPTGKVTDAAVLGSRFVYSTADDNGAVIVTSSAFDGTDRIARPANGRVVLLPDGWIDVRVERAAGRDTAVLFRNFFAGTPAQRLTTVLQGPFQETPRIVATEYSTEMAAFSVTEFGRTSAYRFTFAPAALSLIGDGTVAIDGIRWQWTVKAVNGTAVTMTGTTVEGGHGSPTRWVPANGPERVFAGGGDRVVDLGTHVAWNAGSAEWTIGKLADGTTERTYRPWFTERDVYSTGTAVYSADALRGVVRTDAAGGNAQVVFPGTKRPLTVGRLDISDGTVAWTDDSAATDATTVPLGPQFQAWSRTLSATGAGVQRAIHPDVRATALAQLGSDAYVAPRADRPPLLRISATGTVTQLTESLQSTSQLVLAAAGRGGLLLDDQGRHDRWQRFDFAFNVETSTQGLQSFNDDWGLRTDYDSETQRYTLFVRDLRDDTEREITHAFGEAHLDGSTLIWVSGDQASPGGVLHWVNLADPAAVVRSAPLEGVDIVQHINGAGGWFVLSGFKGTTEVSLLFQTGAGRPRAVLAGADPSVVGTTDGRFVTWVTNGPRGQSVVAAPVPTSTVTPVDVAGMFVPVTPTRVVDTRGGRTLGRDGTIRVPVTGAGSIPTFGVSAVVANVTVTRPSADGNLSVYPSDTPKPLVSNVNFVTSQTVPNLVTVPVGEDGSISVSNNSVGLTDVIVDIAGYYLAGRPTGAGAFVPVTPTRLVDSRSGLTLAGPWEQDQTRSVAVTGAAGVPTTGVAAVVANVTVTQPTAEGNVVVFPSGATRPEVSNLNFSAGQSVPNLVTVPVGPDGRIAIRNNSVGRTHILVDIAGYYRAGTPTAPGSFVAVNPTRVVDSRVGRGLSGALARDQNARVPVGGVGGAAAGEMAAVVANVTVTEPTDPGNLSVYAGTVKPTVSNLNFGPRQTIPNLVVSALAPDGSVVLSNNSSGRTQVIVDVAGYFRGWS